MLSCELGPFPLPMYSEAIVYKTNFTNSQSNMVPTGLMELFEKAPPDVFAKDLPKIMDKINKMTKDEKCVITRLQFLEEIPNIAVSAAKHSTRIPELNQLLSEHLLPIIFQNLSHNDNNVRKIAQSSLFALMEKNLFTPEQIETQICPTILELTDLETLPNYNSGYIKLMSQFVLLLGREITERVFLGRFSKLCSDHDFCVRRSCILHIGDFCAVVGKEAFDNVLLPTYIKLCSDTVWGVRKSCAEVVMYVSCACSQTKRQNILAPIFDKLLQDENRWVRMSAFRTLGPFISTFADPSISTLVFNNLGELVLMNKDGSEFRVSQILSFLKKNDFSMFCPELNESDVEDIFGEQFKRRQNRTRETEEIVTLTHLFEIENMTNVDVGGGDSNGFEKQNGDFQTTEYTSETETFDASSELENCSIQNSVENLEEFNSYKYWYVSPEMPLDPSIINSKPITAKVTLPDRTLPQVELIRTPTLDVREDIESNKFKQLDVRETSPTTGSLIVPQLLIDHFVSMTNSSLAQEIDQEIPFHCAYSLPAVALTLGSKNWHLIQDTVEILAANMQYKVRRTVACCLHELATILGPDIATNDLTPLFEGFIKDLDEVRIGVLQHLAHFLRLINPSKRNMYLPWLESFLQTDNKANWRFRQELAEQLLLVVPLFRPGDVSKHISVLAQELLCDKVAAVREVALLLVTELIQHVSSDQTRTSRLLVKLAEKFAHSIQWKLRQLFALLCSALLTSRALPPEQFACEVMPHLLDLSWDPVPNVRLVVARTIAEHIVTHEYFADTNNQHYDSLQSVLRRLQSDKDRDVRQSAVCEK
ncbi:hypothetical protein FQR65_LT11712, partial [Abscondita terminalis]